MRYLPYRIGIVITIVVIIISASFIFENFETKFLEKRRISTVIMSLVFAGIFVISYYGDKSINYTDLQNNPLEMKKVVSWIKNKTTEDALFLNYSNINVRLAYRFEYFSQRWFSMYAGSQIDWYKRLLIFFDVPEAMSKDYKAVAKYRTAPCEPLHISRVVARMQIKPDFLLTGKNEQVRTLEYDNYPIVFETEHYKILHLKQ